MKVGRRYKSYSGETGVTYRYFFESRRRVVRPEGQGPGTDFLFVVIADQYPPFTLRVFVSDRALSAWIELHGRALDSSGAAGAGGGWTRGTSAGPAPSRQAWPQAASWSSASGVTPSARLESVRIMRV